MQKAVARQNICQSSVMILSRANPTLSESLCVSRLFWSERFIVGPEFGEQQKSGQEHKASDFFQTLCVSVYILSIQVNSVPPLSISTLGYAPQPKLLAINSSNVLN
jgi:hypothetical protein